MKEEGRAGGGERRSNWLPQKKKTALKKPSLIWVNAWLLSANLFFAFVYNAKSFAMAFVFLPFLFYLISVTDLEKFFFCQCFIIHYPWSVWPVSELLIWLAMCFHVMCFNGRLKWEYKESFPSTTKDTISPPNLTWCRLTMRGSHPLGHLTL